MMHRKCIEKVRFQICAFRASLFHSCPLVPSVSSRNPGEVSILATVLLLGPSGPSVPLCSIFLGLDRFTACSQSRPSSDFENIPTMHPYRDDQKPPLTLKPNDTMDLQAPLTSKTIRFTLLLTEGEEKVVFQLQFWMCLGYKPVMSWSWIRSGFPIPITNLHG